MAIIAGFTTRHGARLDAAYIRIEDVRQRNVPFQPARPGLGMPAVMPHTIGAAMAIIYVGADERAMEKPALDSEGFNFVVDTSEDAPSLIAQAYAAYAARDGVENPVPA